METAPDLAAGFGVAALVAGDASLAAALPGLEPALAARLALPELPLSRQHLPRLLAGLSGPFPAAAALLPRLRGVAAGRLPRDVAATYLVGVPLPRPGYRPSEALCTWARRAIAAPELR